MVQDDKAVYFEECQLKDILKELNLPTWVYYRKILDVLLRTESTFKISELIEKSSLTWRKTYETIYDFIKMGLVLEVPYTFPEDWAFYTLTERKNFKIKNNLPIKGKLPLRYVFNQEALIQHLDNKYQKTIENIDTQTNAEKNRLTQSFSSMINPLMRIFGMKIQI